MNYDTVYYDVDGQTVSVRMPLTYVEVTPRHRAQPLRGFRVVCAVFLDDVCVGWTVLCQWSGCTKSLTEHRAVSVGDSLCDRHLTELGVTGNAYLKGSTTSTPQNPICVLPHNSDGQAKTGPIPGETSACFPAKAVVSARLRRFGRPLDRPARGPLVKRRPRELWGRTQIGLKGHMR